MSTKTSQKWTLEEGVQLGAAVAQEEQAGRTINWQNIARRFPRRTNKDCRKRWYYQMSQPLQRGPWSREEDERLRQGVQKYGTRWNKVADLVRTRNGDQCYKRWNDNLDPQIDKSPWTAEEDSFLLQGVQTMGRSWKEIVNNKLPYRTGLAAKNRYSCLQRQMENSKAITRNDICNWDKQLQTRSNPSEYVDEVDNDVLNGNPQSNDSLNSLYIGRMLVDMNESSDMTGSMDILPPGLNLKLGTSSGQVDLFSNSGPPTTGFLPTINPHASPVSNSDFHHWRSLEDFSPHNACNHFMDWMQPNNISVQGTSSKRQNPIGTATGDVVARATCHPGQTKSVQEELTKVLYDMALRGEIKNFNLSVEYV